MLYGQGHKYAKYEMEIVLHCIWLIKGCQLCILVTDNGYGYGHGVCVAFGQCQLFYFQEPSGYLLCLAKEPPIVGCTTIILSLGQ